MLHLIRSPRAVTVVMDDPKAAQMASMLDDMSRMDIPNTYREAA